SLRLAGAAVDFVCSCDSGPAAYSEATVDGQADQPSVTESEEQCFDRGLGPNVTEHDSGSEEIVWDSDESVTSESSDDTGASDLSVHGSGGDNGGVGVSSQERSSYNTPLAENGSVDRFRDDLRQWSITNNISHEALSALLKLAKGHPCFSSLPSCAKTLLETPRSCPTIVELGGGLYCHFGLAAGLYDNLQALTTFPDCLCLQINIDGLPLAKNTRDQFWPILCRVSNCGNGCPFPVGVFHGQSKPEYPNEFMQAFVNMASLQGTGILLGGNRVPVKLTEIICDAPVKAFVLSIKGHNGYFSCTKCTTEGKAVGRRLCFPQFDAELRTDESFRALRQEEHHTGTTVLEELPVDLVKDVPLDYMHLVLLGVMKKLIFLWFSGPSKYRQGRHVKEDISERHCRLQQFICSELSRRPRSLSEVDRWKATEFKLILLYTGPLVFVPSLPKIMYKNFMSLHVALTIFSSPRLGPDFLDYAEQLLLHFVRTFIAIYGEDRVSLNIHGLIHLAADVRAHGPVNGWSAFPFENYMQKLKKQIRNPEMPLQQLYKRVMEERSVDTAAKRTMEPSFSFGHNRGPLPAGCRGPPYKKVVVPNKFVVKTDARDSCFAMNDGSIVQVSNIASFSSGAACIVGTRFLVQSDLYTYPCKSSMLGIFEVSNPSNTTAWALEDISCKCLKFEYESKKIVFPLVHDN
ncbi:unnamed protein product, partial [Ixodes hexagonus]